ncbi:unnamed protein product [Oreochromis niloticus]|nr:unnamed protein product [Mustela putorius furo]
MNWWCTWGFCLRLCFLLTVTQSPSFPSCLGSAGETASGAYAIFGCTSYRGLASYGLVEERKCTSLPSSPAKRVSPTKKKQFYINQAIRNSDLTPRAKGKKSLRRQENTPYLANLLEKDECSKDDLEVCSNPAIPSIFYEFCTNGNYVEPWNDFMNCSGEEQERLLSLLELEEAKKKNTNQLLKDQRNVNPAFTGQDCFQRIDRRLRATLEAETNPHALRGCCFTPSASIWTSSLQAATTMAYVRLKW